MQAGLTETVDDQALSAWLGEFLGHHRIAGLSPQTIPDQPFEALGMDSIECLAAVLRLEERFGWTLDAGLFLRHTNLAGVIAELRGEMPPP